MADQRPTAEALLARIKEQERARLRIYIGAAPGVGKTYEMLQEAHALRARGLDVVVGLVETYGRPDTQAQIKDLEIVPRRAIEYRGVTLEEMDVDAIIARKPQVCVVDELAHTNVPGSRHEKRYEDVLEILDAGIHVMTAVNIQHLETLNDAVATADGRPRARDGSRHVPRSRRRSDQRRRHGRGAAQPAARRARSTSRRRSSRRSPTSSARATCRRCASWRCGRSPTKSARRRRATGSAKGWSRR